VIPKKRVKHNRKWVRGLLCYVLEKEVNLLKRKIKSLLSMITKKIKTRIISYNIKIQIKIVLLDKIVYTHLLKEPIWIKCHIQYKIHHLDQNSKILIRILKIIIVMCH
jgi:hypothetical protein